jgi:hypothetical protein
MIFKILIVENVLKEYIMLKESEAEENLKKLEKFN